MEAELDAIERACGDAKDTSRLSAEELAYILRGWRDRDSGHVTGIEYAQGCARPRFADVVAWFAALVARVRELEWQNAALEGWREEGEAAFRIMDPHQPCHGPLAARVGLLVAERDELRALGRAVERATRYLENELAESHVRCSHVRCWPRAALFALQRPHVEEAADGS